MGNKDSSNNQIDVLQQENIFVIRSLAVFLLGLSLILPYVQALNIGIPIYKTQFDWIALILIGAALFSNKLNIPRNLAMSINGIGILIPIYRWYKASNSGFNTGIEVGLICLIIAGILVYVKLFFFSDNKSESQTIPSVTSEAIPKETQAETKAESTTDQIKKLAELKDQGILTEEEFEAKKKELLDRI
jgi:hypothetical protein